MEVVTTGKTCKALVKSSQPTYQLFTARMPFLSSTNSVTALEGISLSVLTAIFPVEPRLAGFIEAKDDGSGVDNWNYKTCRAAFKSSPPTNQHSMFYMPDNPFLSPNQQCRSTKGKYHIPWTCSPQAHLEVFQLCLWPLIATGYLERIAMPLVSPLMQVMW